LKITDFGLYQLRRNNAEHIDSYAYWKRFLWTAPELLRAECECPKGSQKGDVYSFSIIVHEIVTRKGVFYLGDDICKEPKGILIKYYCDL
jgi:atrial natriuretic peptide receptor A